MRDSMHTETGFSACFRLSDAGSCAQFPPPLGGTRGGGCFPRGRAAPQMDAAPRMDAATIALVAEMTAAATIVQSATSPPPARAAAEALFLAFRRRPRALPVARALLAAAASATEPPLFAGDELAAVLAAAPPPATAYVMFEAALAARECIVREWSMPQSSSSSSSVSSSLTLTSPSASSSASAAAEAEAGTHAEAEDFAVFALELCVARPALPAFVREQLLLTVAVVMKRGWLDASAMPSAFRAALFARLMELMQVRNVASRAVRK